MLHELLLLGLLSPAFAAEGSDSETNAPSDEAEAPAEEAEAPAEEAPASTTMHQPVTAFAAQDALALRNTVREYKQKRLEVRSVSDLSVSATRYTVTATQVDTWSVFRGEQRLDTYTYLQQVGAMDDHDELVRRRKRNTRVTVGGIAAGAAMFIAGSTLMSSTGCDSLGRCPGIQAGGALMIAGVAPITIGAFTWMRNTALRNYPSLTHDLDRAHSEVDAYNDELAAGLGLTAEQLLQIED